MDHAETLWCRESDPYCELLEAARGMLLGGKHDGPCDHVNDPDVPCWLHRQMFATRKARLAAAVEWVDRAEGKHDHDFPHRTRNVLPGKTVTADFHS